MSREWILSPEALTLMLNLKRNKQRYHDSILKQLLFFIYAQITHEVNYDHVITTIPKKAIPLTYRGKRYDISFIHNNRIFYVQIDSESITMAEEHGSE